MTDLIKELPVPEQTEGAQKDFRDSVILQTKSEACAFYVESKNRLLDVNNWDNLCGAASATFKLTSNEGRAAASRPQPGFHFKIDIPGPGASAGDGYDWVRVEEIVEHGNNETDTEYTLIRVRPATDPTNDNKDIAHFFSDKATSNFLVLREGNEVTAAVLGRNEVENTEHNENLLDKVRNYIIGATAKIGMADPQWKSLVSGILNKK